MSLPAGAWRTGIDSAIFLKANRKNYFFKSGEYLRLSGTTVDTGYPQLLPGGWEGLPASWFSGIDAAIFLKSNGKNYFFKDNQYLRLTGTTVDEGYPQRLPGGWEGLPASWNSGIDAAFFLRSNGKNYFFKGNQYVRLTGTKVDPGYPVRLPGGWEGLPVSWYSGIDAAIFLRSNGKTYFFKGNEYVRLTGTKVDPGYPQRLPGGWKGLR